MTFEEKRAARHELRALLRSAKAEFIPRIKLGAFQNLSYKQLQDIGAKTNELFLYENMSIAAATIFLLRRIDPNDITSFYPIYWLAIYAPNDRSPESDVNHYHDYMRKFESRALRRIEGGDPL